MMSGSADTPAESGTSYNSRRTVPRYSLIATAEIIEPASDVHFSGRISEISRKGCFIDFLNPLPIQTVIQVRITRDQGNFESSGRIIYVQEGMGMGVGFLDTPAEQLETLDSWLAESPTL
jgi:hypothetical protein